VEEVKEEAVAEFDLEINSCNTTNNTLCLRNFLAQQAFVGS
jgi:hypothetical protein